MIAKVLPDISLDREFDYLVPPELLDRVKPGCRVSVGFGKQQLSGWVVALSETSDCPPHKLKPLTTCTEQYLPETLLKLAEWISEYYCASRTASLRTFLPAPVRAEGAAPKVQRVLRLAPEIHPADLIAEIQEKHPQQAAIIRELQLRHEATAAALARAAKCSAGPVNTMLEKKYLVAVAVEVERDPFSGDRLVPTQPLTLTDEQKVALDITLAEMASPEPLPILCYGITGCGKTEVYLQAIAACLEQGKQAIVLVPEISLTPQTVQRFRARFGDKVSVLHSRLSDGERFDQWMKIHRGQVQIAVGARSALFSPFRNLGLIVVDEEHEPSYKQGEAPRYHARDVAVMRGRFDKCAVLLGTATPSFESFANARRGKYRLATIRQRADNAALPQMKLIDMRLEAATQGQAQIFSKPLVDAIYQNLNEKMQTILFLNRRGFATQLQCTVCGFVAECPACSLKLTYHREKCTLACHLCGEVQRAPDKCPKCSDPAIRYSGLGTEKIESLVQKIAPKARIVRMDSDTMTGKDSHKKTLDAFQAHEYDILIGTQMIAKGLHFPKVTLVGVVFADMSLNIPDFRAAERTFQLLVQVSGRSGRGSDAGRVLVQSYTPFHHALQASMTADYDNFYNEEIAGREALSFPPFAQMAIVHFRGPEAQALQDCASRFHELVAPHLAEGDRLMPALPSPLARAKNLFRFQVSIFTPRMLRTGRILRAALTRCGLPKDCDAYIDIDAQSLG